MKKTIDKITKKAINTTKKAIKKATKKGATAFIIDEKIINNNINTNKTIDDIKTTINNIYNINLYCIYEKELKAYMFWYDIEK